MTRSKRVVDVEPEPALEEAIANEDIVTTPEPADLFAVAEESQPTEPTPGTSTDASPAVVESDPDEKRRAAEARQRNESIPRNEE